MRVRRQKKFDNRRQNYRLEADAVYLFECDNKSLPYVPRQLFVSILRHPETLHPWLAPDQTNFPVNLTYFQISLFACTQSHIVVAQTEEVKNRLHRQRPRIAGKEVIDCVMK